MEALRQRIKTEARYLGNGIVKVDGFLNHRVDTVLMTAIGDELARRLLEEGAVGINKVVTAETSGIPPALTTAQALGVPMVYARKKRPVTLVGKCFQSTARSHTKGDVVTLHVSSEYLSNQDRVVLIDDFLGYGETTKAMLDIIEQSQAALCGVGYVIEKRYEQGRSRLQHVSAPVISLATIDLVGDIAGEFDGQELVIV